AECVNLRTDGDARNVIARYRKRRLQRPGTRFGVVDLMEIGVEAMSRVAGNDVDVALALDHGVLAGRDRQPRLLDPAAWITGLRRNAGDVALLFDRRRDRRDRAIVQPGE